MKIRINPHRLSGCVPCGGIVIGMLVIAVGAMLVVVVVKTCNKLLPPKKTNDVPQIRMTGQAQPMAQPVIPQGAIVIQRATDGLHSNWMVMQWMTLQTNNDAITITTYDSSGSAVTSKTFTAGVESITNEVFDTEGIWPSAFYRVTQ